MRLWFQISTQARSSRRSSAVAAEAWVVRATASSNNKLAASLAASSSSLVKSLVWRRELVMTTETKLRLPSPLYRLVVAAEGVG